MVRKSHETATDEKSGFQSGGYAAGPEGRGSGNPRARAEKRNAMKKQTSWGFFFKKKIKKKKLCPRGQKMSQKNANGARPKVSTQKTFTTCRQNARFSLEFFWVTLTFFFQNGGEYFMENHRLWCKTFNNNSGQEQRET